MKILYITPSIPNNFSRVRTLNLIKSFKYLGNDVDVISLYTKKNELKNLHALEDVVNNIKIIKQPKILSYINCAFGLLLPVPLQNSYVCNLYLHLYLLFTQKKKNYDLIYIKRLRMAQYAKYFPKSKVFTFFFSLYFSVLSLKTELSEISSKTLLISSMVEQASNS